ncbi:MAG: hypothetical protein EXR79_03105 [Myxococcales bacterium]|nr:hypothetical protein [Myxococcales bacterium]
MHTLSPPSARFAPPAGVRVTLAAVVAAFVLVACGPVYVQDRDDGYYGYNPPPYGAASQPYGGAAGTQQTGPDEHFGDLSAHGTWVWTADHGRVWVPYANRTAGWRPYFYGRWVFTDYGWTWESDEAWGAGPYHYGRWVWASAYRWAWVPGYTWAPAWVVWRHGGGCVGWAPMPPEGGGHASVHFSYWVFVPQGHMHSHRVQQVVVQPAEVERVYQQTVVIQNQAQIRGASGQAVVYQTGPAPEQAQQWTNQPTQTRAVDSVPSAAPRGIPAGTREPTPGRGPPASARDGGRSGLDTGPLPGRGVGPDPAGGAPSRGGVAPGEAPPERSGTAGEIPDRRADTGHWPTGTLSGQEQPPGVRTPPGYAPPPAREAPGYAPPPAREPPAYQPPPAREAPGYAPPAGRQPPPAYTPPAREAPGYAPPAGREPPPAYTPPAREAPGYAPPAGREPPPAYTPPAREAPPPAPTRPGSSYEAPARGREPPPAAPAAPPSRPGAGYEPPPAPAAPPSRPGAGYEPPPAPAAPPSRPGAGYEPPTRRGDPPPNTEDEYHKGFSDKPTRGAPPPPPPTAPPTNTRRPAPPPAPDRDAEPAPAPVPAPRSR